MPNNAKSAYQSNQIKGILDDLLKPGSEAANRLANLEAADAWPGFRQIIGGRLTTSSSDPLASGSGTTLYYLPHTGNQIALYDGGGWNVYSFSDASLSNTGLAVSTNYDIFAYANGEVVTLEALAWANDSTRATALVFQDGVRVKTGALTRRYLGTIRTTSGTQFQDSSTGRLVWNLYNQVLRESTYSVTGSSHTYNAASWRAWNNASTNSLPALVGLASTLAVQVGGSIEEENGVKAIGLLSAGTATGTPSLFGVGLDNTLSVRLRVMGTGQIALSAGYSAIYAIEFGSVASPPVFENLRLETLIPA